MSESSLPEGALLAAASQALTKSGYQEIGAISANAVDATRYRVFEDVYSVVLVAAFPSVAALIDQWAIAQTSLTALISRTIRERDPKAWDGYLVLLSGSQTQVSEEQELANIASDTRRARKIVVVPSMVGPSLDLSEALLPLLPIPEVNMALGSASATMEILSAELDSYEAGAVAVLLDANEANVSLMDALERYVAESGRSN